MMKKNKAIITVICSFLLLFVSACGKETEEEKVFNPNIDGTYTMEDIIKPQLMWNTAELFSTAVKIEEVTDVKPGSGMTAVKFEGRAYPEMGLSKTMPFAVIGTPLTAMPSGGYPAIVLVHGGAGQVFTEWVKLWMNRGYVAIAIDLFGNELDSNLVKVMNFDGGPNETHSGSLNDGVDVFENSWVYHSVANVILAHNILRANEKVNPNQIGVTGISWGGVVTEIVAGVDKRFAAFAPVYAAGYLYENIKWAGGTFGGTDAENRQKWIELFDPSSYLPYATKPMLFVSGIDDNCFSVKERVKSYSLAKGKVFYSQRSDLSHGYFWEQTYEVYSFMQHVLRGENTVVKFKQSGIDGNGKAYVEIENTDFVQSLTLLYTTSQDSDSFKWQFSTQTLNFTEGINRYTLPEGTTAFAFEASNASQSIYFKMSTEIFLN